jgi:Protein of unknown function (DUF1573)
MNKISSLILLLAISAAACNSSANPDTEVKVENTTAAGTPVNPVTTIQWVDSVKNIGKVSEGEKVEIAFKFINTGSHPLVINNVVASCGCTIAEKPEAPVAPGKEGYIKASFDSQGRIGSNHKTLTVYANTAEATYPLVFDVEVMAKN